MNITNTIVTVPKSIRWKGVAGQLDLGGKCWFSICWNTPFSCNCNVYLLNRIRKMEFLGYNHPTGLSANSGIFCLPNKHGSKLRFLRCRVWDWLSHKIPKSLRGLLWAISRTASAIESCPSMIAKGSTDSSTAAFPTSPWFSINHFCPMYHQSSKICKDEVNVTDYCSYGGGQDEYWKCPKANKGLNFDQCYDT